MFLKHIMTALKKGYINIVRTRARRELLAYSDRLLDDSGFSRALLESGNQAWPWRSDDTSPEAAKPFYSASAVMHSPAPALTGKASSHATAVAELRACSDADLADLGISRAGIKDAVRYGRPGLDRDWDSDRKAA